MHVLVMTESWQAALACIQSFGRRGQRVSVLYHPNHLSPHAYSRYVQKRIPFEHDTGTRAERAARLLQLLRAESVDLVIPINDEDAHLLAECKVMEPERQGLIAPTLANIDIVRDRAKTGEFCRDSGISIPESLQVSSPQELREAAAQLGFPMIIKESFSFASNGVGRINNESDLAAMEGRLPAGRTLQAQRFIQGELVGVTGFGWKGQLKGSFSFRVDYQYSLGGTPPYSFTETGSDAAAMLAQVVQCLDWNGGIDLDLIRDSAGKLHLLEINPRLSGTSIFPLKLGIDLPRLYEVALDDSFDKLNAPPPIPESVLFISNPEEVVLLSSDPQVNLQKSTDLRRKFRYVESLFLDDPGLTRNQLAQFMQLALLTPKAAP